MAWLFAGQAGSLFQSLIFTLLMLPVVAGGTYLFTYLLVPNFLLTGAYRLFFLYSAYTIIGAVWLEFMIISLILATVAQFKFSALNPAFHDLTVVAGGLTVAMLPAVTLLTTRQWYRTELENQRLQKQTYEADLMRRESELKLLRNQIHPHFLFNTLNNLYGLALEQSEQTPEMIMKISNLLDYLLYRSDQRSVPLERELDHLQEFVELYTIRYDEALNITFEKGEIPSDCEIPPMLLLPLLENCFKHGVDDAATSWIEIYAGVEQNRIHVQLANSVPAAKGRSAGLDKNGEGIGQQNVQKRLSHLFGEDHTFRVTTDDAYRVWLEIPNMNRYASHQNREEVS